MRYETRGKILPNHTSLTSVSPLNYAILRKIATSQEEIMRIHIHRLGPHQDLKESLEQIVHQLGLNAGFVISCVGSVLSIRLRMAGADVVLMQEGPFEIVSLVGTLSDKGCHLHASFSDGQGQVIGGHLLSGCPIYTTAEIVLGESHKHQFDRQLDPETGYDELVVHSLSSQ